MPQCPQCNKPLVELTRQCPSCRAELDLLVDYVNGLQVSLNRAEQFTRAGDLAQAVWAYLEVLEVDPDNPSARRQVGKVATAVRQFDGMAPGRRWIRGLPPLVRGGNGKIKIPTWARAAIIGVVVMGAFGLGFLCGHGLPEDESPPDDPAKKTIAKPLEHQLGPAPRPSK